MTRRSAPTQADIRRTVKGVIEAGMPVGSFKVVVEDGRLTILPIAQAEAPVEASVGYSKALEKWRRSA